MALLLRERRRRAITLMELMVIIIIIGILAAIAIPMFPRTMEMTKAKEAVVSLQQIRTAERIYRVEENTYWRTESHVIYDNATLNEQLRLYLDVRDNRNWDYSITATRNTFTATAKRRSDGGHSGETIVFDQDGLDTGSSTWTLPLPGQ